MLKKCNRIALRNSFIKIKERGKAYYNPLFTMITLRTEGEGRRFGFVVSKKISKKAVARNRIRRLLSEVVRKDMDLFPSDSAYLFIVRPTIVGKKLFDLEEAMTKVRGCL